MYKIAMLLFILFVSLNLFGNDKIDPELEAAAAQDDAVAQNSNKKERNYLSITGTENPGMQRYFPNHYSGLIIKHDQVNIIDGSNGFKKFIQG